MGWKQLFRHMTAIDMHKEREREERVSCATGRGRGEERDAHEDRIDRPREAVRR